MSRKGIGVATALGTLAVVGIAALTMWYTTEVGPADDTLSDEVTERSEAAPISNHATDAPAKAPVGIAEPEIQVSGRLMVEIQGAVVSPGVYSFPPEARVHDALQKAGGPLDHAEIRDLNIAAALVDGSVLSVPYQQQDSGPIQAGAADLNPPEYTRSGWTDTGVASPASTPGAPAAPVSAKVNINTATQAELETLPGVGEKTAEKIIRHRESQSFTQVDDLGYVQGIGEKKLEELRPHVTVE